jgi:hypothetical protein
MKNQTFAVKIQTLDFPEGKLPITNLVSLGEGLTFQQAVELRKQNPKSYTHPENVAFQDASRKVLTPEVVVKQTSVKKHRTRTN